MEKEKEFIVRNMGELKGQFFRGGRKSNDFWEILGERVRDLFFGPRKKKKLCKMI
jgi:hypothetical protein